MVRCLQVYIGIKGRGFFRGVHSCFAEMITFHKSAYCNFLNINNVSGDINSLLNVT